VENASSHEAPAVQETSWWQFWSLDGEQRISTPEEWAPALLEVQRGEQDWTALRLLRNGEPLPLRQEQLGDQVHTIAAWPRSGPGHYELRLLGPETEREAMVSIWPRKITREAYSRLLLDLETELPVQVAVALQKAGGLAGVELNRQEDTTLEQELVRLRRATEGTGERLGLTDVLRQLAGRPHRILTSEERWVRRGRARRPRADRLGQAFARPGNATGGTLQRVPDARSHHTADVYENRLLRQFARQVRFRLRRIEPVLRERSEEAADTARGLLDALRAARRQADFLDAVSRLNRPPTRASMVLQKRPLYRAVLEGYLEFQREISVMLDAPALEAPLDNLPFLYQLWSTLYLVRVVLDVAREEGYRVDRSSLFQREEGFLVLRMGGTVARLIHPETSAEVEIYAERTYGAGRGGLHSVSYAQRPDIAIEVTPPTGGRVAYLFDPKYKLDVDRYGTGSEPDDPSRDGRPTKADIDKMHAYRDAIRGADGRRIVRYAAILFPGQTESFAAGLEAIGAHPGAEKAFTRKVRRRARCALRNASL
jgi:hypothetical protein